MNRPSQLWFAALCGTLLPLALSAGTAQTSEPSIPPTNRPSFIRFVAGEGNTGRVETALKTYRNAEGVEVTLFAAVHVGDRAYYQGLEDRFPNCDALLYEMIRDSGPAGGAVEVDTANPVSALQLGMKRVLELEFQLEAIDYTATNFVHADLDPRTFFRLQRERNESLLGLMIRVMLEEQARLNRGEGTTVDSFGLLMALMNPDRGYALKLVLGAQMEQLEAMVAGIEDGPDGQGSVIVSARNEHAIKIMREQIGEGRRRLGIFYGAAHMPDFEERLAALGFQPVKEEWVTAWDIRPRVPRRWEEGTEH